MTNQIEKDHPIQLTREQREDISMGFEPFPPEYEMVQTHPDYDRPPGPVVQARIIKDPFRRHKKIYQGQEEIELTRVRQVTYVHGAAMGLERFGWDDELVRNMVLFEISINNPDLSRAFQDGADITNKLTTVAKKKSSRDITFEYGREKEYGRAEKLRAKAGGQYLLSSTNEYLAKRAEEVENGKWRQENNFVYTGDGESVIAFARLESGELVPLNLIELVDDQR